MYVHVPLMHAICVEVIKWLVGGSTFSLSVVWVLGLELRSGAGLVGSLPPPPLYISFVWMPVLPTHLHTTCTQCLQRSEKGVGSPDNRSYRWLLLTVWVLGLELGSSEEQPVLLTSEPSFQHLAFVFETDLMSPRLAPNLLYS